MTIDGGRGRQQDAPDLCRRLDHHHPPPPPPPSRTSPATAPALRVTPRQAPRVSRAPPWRGIPADHGAHQRPSRGNTPRGRNADTPPSPPPAPLGVKRAVATLVPPPPPLRADTRTAAGGPPPRGGLRPGRRAAGRKDGSRGRRTRRLRASREGVEGGGGSGTVCRQRRGRQWFPVGGARAFHTSYHSCPEGRRRPLPRGGSRHGSQVAGRVETWSTACTIQDNTAHTGCTYTVHTCTAHTWDMHPVKQGGPTGW